MLSLLRSERKQKNLSNPFRIRTFLLLSYSFRIETINMLIHSHSSLENHARFQTKMDKVYTVLRPKRRKNPTRWGGTYGGGGGGYEAHFKSSHGSYHTMKVDMILAVEKIQARTGIEPLPLRSTYPVPR